MIEEILPPEVASCEAFEDSAEVTLFRQEEAVIARAVDKRRREFATVRQCARRALADLGLAPAPVLPGVRGAPQWPDGVVGSMTHCDGYRAAALAHTSALRAIGIDAEPHDVLPDGTLAMIALPQERDQLHQLGTYSPETHWDRLLFSAKETVYKAWFPLARRWLGFADAEVTIDAEKGSFVAHLLVPGPQVDGVEMTSLTGRWLIRNGLIVTAIAQ